MFRVLGAGLVSALLLFSSGAFAQTPLTAVQAAELLGKSVVAVTHSGQTICSAAKIGPSAFLTAQHCLVMGEKIELQTGQILRIKSILTSFQTKEKIGDSARNRQEDWAILYTEKDAEDVAALPLGCAEKPYLGQEVAYAGFPHPTQYALGLGRVTSLKPTLPTGNNLDYTMDVHAAPGASGSAIISLDSGKVIGILTEGVSSRVGFFMVGFESVANLDACDGLEEVAAAKKPVAPTADALEK